MELDIFVPDHCLAFEYQGEAHYLNIPMYGGLKARKQIDQAKREACVHQGITLIEIPYPSQVLCMSFLSKILVGWLS
jgi:hypothetical protein